MEQKPARQSVYSTMSTTSQTAIPPEVRDVLGLRPGDRIRYRFSKDGVILDKAPADEIDDPFLVFTEWSSDADEEAYAGL